MKRVLFDDLYQVVNMYTSEFKINEYKEAKTLFAKFDPEKYDGLLKIIWMIIMKHMEMGEIINIHSFKGEFRDMGIKTIEIEAGEIWEFYDYEHLEHYFIRLLKMYDKFKGKRWVALYIDYNPNSPWWTERDRK